MSNESDFYKFQAETCARAAAECNLPMQRRKYELAKTAWLKLANRKEAITNAARRRTNSHGGV